MNEELNDWDDDYFSDKEMNDLDCDENWTVEKNLDDQMRARDLM